MKHYLAFIILSLFVVSCHQDDDAEFLQEAKMMERENTSIEQMEELETIYNYQEPNLSPDNGDDPPPKQIGGNGARPAPKPTRSL